VTCEISDGPRGSWQAHFPLAQSKIATKSRISDSPAPEDTSLRANRSAAAKAGSPAVSVKLGSIPALSNKSTTSCRPSLPIAGVAPAPRLSIPMLICINETQRRRGDD